MRFYMVKTGFSNRAEAGRALAERLAGYAGRDDVVVLALPRGGVPVGFEIARRLGAPLDVMIVRKLGVPWHEELAMGAIASGGFRVMNAGVVSESGVSRDEMNAVIQQQQSELERREHLCREGRPALPLAGRTVILVDDGIATGAPMRAAVQAARAANPARLIVATPVAAPPTLDDLRKEADEVVAVLAPAELSSIGQWYADFSQLTDDEVRSLLAGARQQV